MNAKMSQETRASGTRGISKKKLLSGGERDEDLLQCEDGEEKSISTQKGNRKMK